MKMQVGIISLVISFLIACGGGGSDSGGSCTTPAIAGSNWVGTESFNASDTVLNFNLSFFADNTANEGGNTAINWTRAGNALSWTKAIEDAKVFHNATIGCTTLTGTFEIRDIGDNSLLSSGTLSYNLIP